METSSTFMRTLIRSINQEEKIGKKNTNKSNTLNSNYAENQLRDSLIAFDKTDATDILTISNSEVNETEFIKTLNYNNKIVSLLDTDYYNKLVIQVLNDLNGINSNKKTSTLSKKLFQSNYNPSYSKVHINSNL